ncbi:MAG TPA: HlyD family secretion protein [Polyangia bacterium]|jgi:membrane fusion protein (multidrug efflux system)|nr:HlyD family secretion protein [Polyangia bacterium]
MSAATNVVPVNAAVDDEAEPAPVAAIVTAKRKRTPLLLGVLTMTAVIIAGGWWLLTRGTESTDDAQVEGRLLNVSARVAGQVLRIHVEDNQRVEAGELLVELDPADFAAKVDVARANLAAAKATAEGARSALALTEKTAPATLQQARGGLTAAASAQTSAEATIEQARADIAAAESKHALAALNLKRAQALVAEQALPQQQMDERQTAFDSAVADERLARARLRSAEAARTGSGGGIVLARGRLDAAATANEQVAAAKAALSLAEARVQQADAALKLAELDLSYTTVRAPRRGVISRRSVEAGQWVSPERPLVAVVPLDDVWIVANFKEDQLAEMKRGQPAEVRFDTFGRRAFAGHVESLAGGTGARFALLPPDNATGNFVKVVQRVPVLIRLDDAAQQVELRPGMSADVTVKTAEQATKVAAK